MKLYDAIAYAISAISEKRTRSALTVLGILIGPAAVVGITGLTLGYGSAITGQLKELGTNTILVEPSGQQQITPLLIQEISSIKGVGGVYPFYYIPATVRTSSGTEQVTIFAINLQQGLEQAVPGIGLQAGEFPQPFDTYGAAIGYGIANQQQGVGYRVGDTITLSYDEGGAVQSRTFLVEGVLKEFGPSYIINVDKGVFVSLQTGRTIMGNQPYQGLLVVAASSGYVQNITNQIKETYGNQLTVMNSQEALNIANSIIGLLNMLLVSAASVSFIVAFVGVTTTMYTSTMERRKEIGILKALGFKNSDVVRIFVIESGIMGLLGGIAGAALGVLGSYALVYLVPFMFRGSGQGFGNGGGSGFSLSSLQVHPAFSLEIILVAIIASAIIGLLAGTLPAYRASSVDPVKVLRNE